MTTKTGLLWNVTPCSLVKGGYSETLAHFHRITWGHIPEGSSLDSYSLQIPAYTAIHVTSVTSLLDCCYPRIISCHVTFQFWIAVNRVVTWRHLDFGSLIYKVTWNFNSGLLSLSCCHVTFHCSIAVTPCTVTWHFTFGLLLPVLSRDLPLLD